VRGGGGGGGGGAGGDGWQMHSREKNHRKVRHVGGREQHIWEGEKPFNGLFLAIFFIQTKIF